jgi:NAD(P)-dependent dehydrogenase (short-subunit alcohol dehydrogenase family)
VSERLSGKVILVTGSTRGLGRDMVEHFAAQGARVIVTGRSPDAGAEVEQSIADAGGEALYVRCDVTSEREVEAAVASALERWGRLDGLVANASNYQGNSGLDGVLTEITLEGWNKIIASDLTGIFLTLKHGVRAMCAGAGGSVVTVASQHALRGVNGSDGYTAAKGGVVALTRNVASFYARYEVRCNCIAPGVVRTGSPYLEQLLEHPVQGPPVWDVHLGRLGEPRDVSSAASFLLSDEGRWVNGVVLPIDGGAVSASHFRRPIAGDLPQYKRKRERAPRY